MVVVVIYFSRVLLHMHCTEGPAILNGTVVLHRRLLFLQRSAASLIASRGLALFHRSQILFLKNSIAEGQNNTGSILKKKRKKNVQCQLFNLSVRE